MTNLLISYTHVPLGSSSLAEPTGETGFAAKNIVTGPRAWRFKNSSAATTTTFDYDYATTVAPDHLIIARADLLRKSDSAATAWSLRGDSADTFAGGTLQNGTFNVADLKGPRSQDFVTTFTYGTPYRYWRFRVTTTGSFKHEYSKVHFGAWLDLGRDPEDDAIMRRDELTANGRDPAYTVSLRWLGIADAKKQSFIDTIGRRKDVCPVFLYDSGDAFLNDVRLLHCKLLEYEAEPTNYNQNTITATFRELI